jgi:hypothetical protein
VTLLNRIERAVGVPGLADILGDLPQADLRSLLLEVNRRQAAKRTPTQILNQYRDDRFTSPSTMDPLRRNRFERHAFETLRVHGYTPVDLAPVNPLGTVSALTPLDQNLVLTTERGTEVVADATNALALESAVRRTGRERVRLCATHRLLRTQPVPEGWANHFGLLAMTTAGRDEGSFRFETDSLRTQILALMAVVGTGEVLLTDLAGRRDALTEHVVEPLQAEGVDVSFDDKRKTTYYVDACFKVKIDGMAVADGGFTTWTQRLTNNRKERLLTTGLGIDTVFRVGLYP